MAGIKVRFCIVAGNGEYVPVEFELGKSEEFLMSLFNDYNIIKYTQDSKEVDNKQWIVDVKTFNRMEDKPIYEDGYYYKNNRIGVNKKKDCYILFNNKIFIETGSNAENRLDKLSARLNMYFKISKFNEQDKINTGIIIDGKFGNILDLLDSYNIVKDGEKFVDMLLMYNQGRYKMYLVVCGATCVGFKITMESI